METPKIVTLIISDLTTDILKAQENLESSINEKSDIYIKADKIKKALREFAIAELMLSKFNDIVKSSAPQNQ